MLLNLHSVNPEIRLIKQIVSILQNDGVIIYPTDSHYAIGGMMNSEVAVDRICKLRKLDPTKANLTFLCSSIAQLSSYTAPIHNDIFRLIKRNTPGPFTWILKSNNTVPKKFKNKKRTVGGRISNHVFIEALLQHLNQPLLSITLKDENDSFYQEMDEIIADWSNRVEAIISCGIVPFEETGVLDCTGNEIEWIREGSQEIR